MPTYSNAGGRANRTERPKREVTISLRVTPDEYDAFLRLASGRGSNPSLLAYHLLRREIEAAAGEDRQ